jgi:hypothetical protein
VPVAVGRAARRAVVVLHVDHEQRGLARRDALLELVEDLDPGDNPRH